MNIYSYIDSIYVHTFSHVYYFSIVFYFILFFIFSNVYSFFERQSECGSGAGAEREGDRIQSSLQALSCQHRAWCEAWIHELWDHDLSWSQMLNRLSHPGAPLPYFSNWRKLFSVKIAKNIKTILEWLFKKLILVE